MDLILINRLIKEFNQKSLSFILLMINNNHFRKLPSLLTLIFKEIAA